MEPVTSFCEALYLLARFHAPHLQGWLRGRAWERCAAAALRSVAWVSQGPGSLKLFGAGSASGFCHELDSAGHCNGCTIICEAKAYESSSPTKADVCIFDRKTFDLYIERKRRLELGPHWRVLASASELDDEVRRYCYLQGIISSEPSLIPLPVLLRIAGKPMADQFFDEVLLAETVRLGEIACGPMERRYVPEGHHLKFDLRLLRTRDLDDLLWLHKALSSEVLNVADRLNPGHYEGKAALLIDGVSPGFTQRLSEFDSSGFG
jgi:hypothetical protein